MVDVVDVVEVMEVMEVMEVVEFLLKFLFKITAFTIKLAILMATITDHYGHAQAVFQSLIFSSYPLRRPFQMMLRNSLEPAMFGVRWDHFH